MSGSIGVEIRPEGVTARASARRLLPWLVVAIVVVVLGLLLAVLSATPAQSLDPGSTTASGSKALVRVLEHFGAEVRATTSRADAVRGGGRTVVVTAPDDYTDDQLRDLRAHAARLVLVRPAAGALHAVAPDADPGGPDDVPAGYADCADAGVRATGDLDVPGDAVGYTRARGFTRCYSGLLLLSPRVAVVGSADLLTNAFLGHQGLAALAVDTITADRSIRDVSWLRPGDDAGGNGAQSIFDLFPAGAFRALWWLLVVGVLAALWRARRLGAVVSEPLPVVVRSAETVEGHGRLYLRAGARDRAAVALRAATLRRLRSRLALPATASPEQVATVAAPLVGRGPADLHMVLGGPPPADDPALQRLARDLHDLQDAVLRNTTQGSHRAR